MCLSLLVAGCSNDDKSVAEAPNSIETNEAVNQNVQASSTEIEPEAIINAFKEAGLPIGRVVIHDSKSDPNNLLGRPDGYKASAHFEDTTVKQIAPLTEEDVDLPTGGSIEVWPDSDGARKRLDYMEKIDETMNLPQLKQYRYLHNNVLLRLEYEILPESAAQYEQILKQF